MAAVRSPMPRARFTLMKRAADLGSTAALGNLGVYYMKGVGQRADARAALAVFKQGVAKNNAACMFFYAQCLEKGLGGVTPNADESDQLLSRRRGARFSARARLVQPASGQLRAGECAVDVT